jgi:hypothetical protein
VAILAALLAAEIPSARQSLGLAIASTSIMSLGLIGRTHTRSRTAVGLALLTGTLIGLYTFVDGIGVRVGGHASSYISWMFFVDSFPILIFALLRRPGRVAGFLREEGLRATVGGMMAIAGYGAVLWAMSRGAMAPVRGCSANRSGRNVYWRRQEPCWDYCSFSSSAVRCTVRHGARGTTHVWA